MAEINSNHIDTLLAEQTNDLESERKRLDDIHLANEDAGQCNESSIDPSGVEGGDNGSLPSTARSTISQIDAEKRQKEELNLAISEGTNEYPVHQPPQSQRRPVRESDQVFATDSFYSHFPSFNNQNKQREQLVYNRHQDYKDHLVQVAQKEATESRRKQNVKVAYDQEHPDTDRAEPISAPYSSSKQPSPSSVCGDTNEKTNNNNIINNHTEKAPNMNNIQDHADDAIRRKLEYQRDLRKQIDDKRREVAELRARDKAEDEKLTKRLEQQLQAIRLEDELRKERKRSDQARLAHEQNHIYRMHLLSKLDQEKNAYADRMVQSENRNRTESQTDDRKVYQYFRNSARYTSERAESPPPVPQRSFQAFQDTEPIPSSSHRLHSVPESYAEYCKRCMGHMRPTVCNYCERRRHNLPINEDFCLKCSVRLNTIVDRQHGLCSGCRLTDLRCGYCQKHIDVCPNCNAVFCLRCHRRQNVGAENEENESPRKAVSIPSRSPEWPINHRTIPPDLVATKSQKPIEFGSFDGEADPYVPPSVYVKRNDQNPFSTNVPQTSIFHENARVEEPRLAVNIRNGEMFVEDLDEKLAKYARNYSELRPKKLTPKATVGANDEAYADDDPFPVPLMPAQAILSKPPTLSQRHAPESQAVRRLKQKWEVPAVQKNVITTRPRTQQRVLTQLGSIRKQLQLEQMELDNTYVKH